MAIIDMHCDTIAWMLEVNKENADLYTNEFNIDIEKMRRSDYMAQFFAAFVYLEKALDMAEVDAGYEKALKIIGMLEEKVSKYPEYITKVTDYESLLAARETGKIAAIQTVEEAGIIGNDLDRINALYERGVRLMTLTWNFENTLGYPNAEDPILHMRGLKPFGIEAVERMNDLGIIVDVSHLSEGGFYDVAKCSKKPFVASHSNARAVCNHRRNLTDDMLRTLADNGGVTGINFYPLFLGEGENAGSVDTMVRHIRHIENTAGIEAVSLGTDFDGFQGSAEIRDAGEMQLLINGLEKAGYTGSQIDKIMYQNVQRVIKDVWK